MISKKLQEKLNLYEQLYYALDEPVPFKKNLKIYPVCVKDYYKFYNSFSCITMDKSVETYIDENGRQQKRANPKGLSQSYLAFLIEKMKEDKYGPYVTTQVMNLLELVFHIPKGIYCPQCGKQISYEEALSGLKDFTKEKTKEVQKMYLDALEAEIEKKKSMGIEIEDKEYSREIPPEILKKIKLAAENEYYKNMLICPDCKGQMRDVYSIKNQGPIDFLVVKDVELTPNDFDELKAIIPRQNILNYDGDEYMDPDLKEELEIKAKLQNQDYTSPTLEKQLVCVAVGTGMSLEYLKTITMRKLSMFLRTIDRKETYYSQLQASMSGFVEFKTPPKHWIFSEDKKNLKDELTDAGAFERKFDRVT